MIVCLRLEKLPRRNGSGQDQTLHRDRSVTFRFFYVCVFNPFQDFRGEMINLRKEWPRFARLTKSPM